MSQQLPEQADIRQLRIQAKELLRSLKNGEPFADGKQYLDAKLADAQLLIARQYGFDSWPKLVDQVETPVLIEKFRRAVYSSNVGALEKLLSSKPVLRKHINDPIFDFDSPAIVQASRSAKATQVLSVLVQYGGNPNVRSSWWAGGFSALDFTSPEATKTLVALGAKFDVWSAAKQGELDILRKLLDQDPQSLNAAGGDGQRPLHVASNAEVANLLIERGADLEIQDIDHESTPIQYQANNPDVLRVLLIAGAKPDIFTAVVLDDVELLRTILKSNPQEVETRIGKAPFVATHSNGGHIYVYVLGGDKTPHHVAAERGSKAVLQELLREASLAKRLIIAAWRQEEETVTSILQDYPNVATEIGDDARSITDAAQAGRTETVRLLLQAGLDPKTRGMDSGSALHVACWFGHFDVVKLLLDRVPLDLLDAHHGSPPLGWACHGAQFCRNPKGDYVGIVEALIQAGADPNAPANSSGYSMLKQSGDREDVKMVLRSHGAF